MALLITALEEQHRRSGDDWGGEQEEQAGEALDAAAPPAPSMVNLKQNKSVRLSTDAELVPKPPCDQSDQMGGREIEVVRLGEDALNRNDSLEPLAKMKKIARKDEDAQE